MGCDFLKINITINDELLARIDKYSGDNYMTRSGFVSHACNQYLAQVEMNELLRNCSAALATIARTGACDPDAMKQLEQFTLMASIALGDSTN